MDGLENFMGCAVDEFFLRSSPLSIEMEFLGLHTESNHMNQFMGNNVKKKRTKQKGMIILRNLQDPVILKTNSVKFSFCYRTDDRSLVELIFADLRKSPVGFFLIMQIRQGTEVVRKSMGIL